MICCLLLVSLMFLVEEKILLVVLGFLLFIISRLIVLGILRVIVVSVEVLNSMVKVYDRGFIMFIIFIFVSDIIRGCCYLV